MAALLVVAAAACSGGRTSPEPVTIRSLTGPPLLIEGSEAASRERRVIARVQTAALATDVDLVYFGDAAKNELVAVPKRGGERSRLGLHAPLAIALGERIAWIGAPGDVLLATRPGAPADVIAKTHGAFTDVASDGADVLVTDAMTKGGVLLRVRGTTVSRLASFDERPLELATDAMTAFVRSERAIFAVPRAGGAPRLVFEGEELAGLEVSAGFVFTTARVGSSRALVRIPAVGGEPLVLDRAVREGPLAVFSSDVYFVDAAQPALRRVAAQGGVSTVAATAPELARVSKLVVDGSGIYLATEDDRGPVVLGLPRPP